jgi:hypothetical protein
VWANALPKFVRQALAVVQAGQQQYVLQSSITLTRVMKSLPTGNSVFLPFMMLPLARQQLVKARSAADVDCGFGAVVDGACTWQTCSDVINFQWVKWRPAVPSDGRVCSNSSGAWLAPGSPTVVTTASANSLQRSEESV